MAHRILWAVAILMAVAALVAGCFQVNVPEGPYVTVRDQPRQPSAAERSRVQGLDKPALENEVLRLTGENDSLRHEVEKLKRENKSLKDRAQRLEDQIKDMRKR
jgi:predicted RNase H-like nuclease (RuvC/YqgF family)